MRIAVAADEQVGVAEAVVEALRARGHDVLAVAELTELIGRSDIEVARFAHEQGRIVVTENVADFLRRDAGHHSGLLLVSARRWPRRPQDLPRLRRALAAWLDARPEEDVRAQDVGPVDWLEAPDRRITPAR